MGKVKDKIVVWFMQNILIPKSEIIEKPGFIILKLTEARQTINVREVAFPEQIIIELEQKIVEKYGLEGKKALYSIGKKFGYRYANLCKYPTVNNSTSEKINEFFYLFLRYMEAVSFGRKLMFNIDFNKKLYKMRMDKYLVCSKNGIGLILTDGGSAGVWSHTLQDFSIEGVQTRCQGRGDKECEIICAPSEYFKKQNLSFLIENNLKDMTVSKNYETFNVLRATEYCKTSLKDLIQSSFFNFKTGQLEHESERYSLTEASLIYLLEEGLRDLKAEDVLFKVAFDFSNRLIKNKKLTNINKFAMDYLSALGFGDVLIIKKDGKYFARFNYFPWTKFAKDSRFILIKGFLSGLLSNKPQKVMFKDVIKEQNFGYLTISFNEK